MTDKDPRCTVLDGRSAVVTGAGSGMGEAIAKAYAAEGARVVAADINMDNVERVCNEIKQAGGIAIPFLCDVSKNEQTDALIDRCIEEFGSIDILVNNAGIMDNFSPIEELTDAMWDRVMNVNTASVIYTTRKVIPIFREQKRGAIINIASVGGLFGARAGVAYTASKHAVVGITKNTAFMYAREGIRCNAIAPGAIETNIGESIGKHVSEHGTSMTSMGNVMIPKFGKPEQVARVAVFLAMDDSNYINGVVLPVDGGWTAF